LEVSVEECRRCAAFARAYPAVKFFSLQREGAKRGELESLSNLELMHGDQDGIDCRAASFDKVICSLALHRLSEAKKLALLKEMKRVLRHGGVLYLADFDQPSRPMEMHVLRGTGHLFGSETAKRHIDGTWLELIRQVGFVSVRRVTTSSEVGGRVAIVRARRA
jgi:ubiquinone/menaquinone biosynthesis C-methylase UbiE